MKNSLLYVFSNNFLNVEKVAWSKAAKICINNFQALLNYPKKQLYEEVVNWSNKSIFNSLSQLQGTVIPKPQLNRTPSLDETTFLKKKTIKITVYLCFLNQKLRCKSFLAFQLQLTNAQERLMYFSAEIKASSKTKNRPNA